jgi:CHAD domain-containing protein
MSFELRLNKALRKNIHRIARKQMDQALEALSGNHAGPRDVAVHEARKSFKRIRAVLRLVRSEIGERNYSKENRCFRDAGRPLTEVRDAKILVEALDKLAAHFKEQITARTFGHVREALQENLRTVRKQLLDEQHTFAVVTRDVRQALERSKDWAEVRNKWAAVDCGLKRSYRRARDAYGDASAEPTVEKLHEWRKQVKYLRYQLEILRPLWPERLDELIQEAERMGEFLGEDHDLAVLQQMLSQDAEKFGDPSDIEAVSALAQRRRAELEQDALLLGERYFQDGPKAFVRRLKGYWKAAKAVPATRPVDAG